MNNRSAEPALPLALAHMAVGLDCVVQEVRAPADAPEWERWLDEIGFIRGERVTVMAKGIPGGDPLMVRVGLSTFALRRAEAACVYVVPATSIPR